MRPKLPAHSVRGVKRYFSRSRHRHRPSPDNPTEIHTEKHHGVGNCYWQRHRGRRVLGRSYFTSIHSFPNDAHMFLLQGRAGLVAFRRSRGGVGALGKAFYKGGFEQRMNKKEATLILSLK